MTKLICMLILRVFRWLTFRGKNPSRYTYRADVAMVNPFRAEIYTLPAGYPLSPRLKAHEEHHITQIHSDGRFKFIVKYLWYTLRYGYKNNPYEVEAREAANE